MMRLSSLYFVYLTLAAGMMGVPADHPRLSPVPRAAVRVTSIASRSNGASGIPFGLTGMTGRKLVEPYTGAMQQANPETILQDLAAARARGVHMIVNFAGSSEKTTAEGHFSYDLWKARVDRFLPLRDQLNGYVGDGTLLLSYLIDEPNARKRWGQAIPMETLDQMAEYSKSLFPDLTTTIRAAPRELQHYRWHYLDVAWAQYTARKGPVAEYASTEAATAKSEGLGLITGLNISKGGDGSSGFGSASEPSMSGAEIVRYGQALLQVPDVCAFISWDNRPNVIDRPDVAAALKQLAVLAKSHPDTPCRRKGNPSSP
jgi:hypothetical protein